MANKYKLPWLQQLRKEPSLAKESYHYEALPSADSIRLLKLKPGRGLEQLECELEIARIDFLPKYEALSYSTYLLLAQYPSGVITTHPLRFNLVSADL